MNESNEIMNPIAPAKSIANQLLTGGDAFCSFEANTPERKALLYNAMQNPDKRLGDCINMTLNVKDFYVHAVELENEKTGEMETVPRIVLIDVKGVSYVAVSIGIFGALRSLCTVYGQPSEWGEKGLALDVKQITKGEKKMLSLALHK